MKKLCLTLIFLAMNVAATFAQTLTMGIATSAAPTFINNTPNPLNMTTGGSLRTNATNISPYSLGTTTSVISDSGNVANAIATATLAANSTRSTYLSGFEITGAGATAGLPVTVTITGLVGGTRNYTYVFATGATVANTPIIVEFVPGLISSAINTAVVITCPASGIGGTNNTVVAHGYYQ